MAGSVNKVILVGNLGRDPEVRRLGSGEPVVNLRVATSESWKDKNSGERKEKTEWHSVVIFNENLAKVAESYLKKGSKIYLEGQLQTRKWQDPCRPGEIHDRNRASALPGRIDDPGQPRGGRHRGRRAGRRPRGRFRQHLAHAAAFGTGQRSTRGLAIQPDRRRHSVLNALHPERIAPDAR